MSGNRKIVITAMGLLALLILAFLSAYGSLNDEALSDLSWAVYFIVGTALGANVGEHWTKRPAAQGPVPSSAG